MAPLGAHRRCECVRQPAVRLETGSLGGSAGKRGQPACEMHSESSKFQSLNNRRNPVPFTSRVTENRRSGGPCPRMPQAVQAPERLGVSRAIQLCHYFIASDGKAPIPKSACLGPGPERPFVPSSTVTLRREYGAPRAVGRTTRHRTNHLQADITRSSAPTDDMSLRFSGKNDIDMTFQLRP